MSRHAWKLKGHVQVSKAAVFALRASDLKVYATLLAHYNRVRGDCFPSISTIAHESDLSEATVKRSRNRLKDLGLLNWIVNKRFRNSCMYDFPLEHGAEADRARVIRGLGVRSPVSLPFKGKKRSKR